MIMVFPMSKGKKTLMVTNASSDVAEDVRDTEFNTKEEATVLCNVCEISWVCRKKG